MPDANDMDLVRDFARQNSEAVFAELVRRHINLVYSIALRCTGSPEDAQDVTQAVFIILAQKAAGLRERTVLTGWLYETTRFTAARLLRTKARRAAREQEAYMQSTLNEPDTEGIWRQLAPHLEDAMGRLVERDRTLLALRFYESKTGAEAAALLGIGEDAAHKRTVRALEKLRTFFSKRGVTLTAAVIAGAVTANSVQAAPVGLVVTVTATAAKGALVGGSTLTLVKGALKLMAWTKMKMAAATGAAVLLTAGTATVALKTYYAMRTQPDIQGAWEGVVQTQPGSKLRVVLKVIRENGVLRATGDSIDQRAKDIPVNKIECAGRSIHFEMASVNGSFAGTFDDGLTTMTGTWKQPEAGLVTPLILKRTTSPSVIPERLKPVEYTPRSGSDLQGYWAGTLSGVTDKTVVLRVAFKISESSDGKFIAELDSLDQGANALVVSSVNYDKPTVRMEIGNVGGVFEGDINQDKTEITGNWTQLNHPQPLVLRRTSPSTAQTPARKLDYAATGPEDIAGHWKGTLDIRGFKLRLALHIGRQPDGKMAALLDSLDQGANGLPSTTVRVAAATAHLEWKTIGGVFDGKAEDGKLSGTWQQGGQSFPLVFERGEH